MEKRILKKQFRRIYIASFLATAAMVELAWFIYDLFAAPSQAPWVLLYAGALFIGGAFVYRKVIRIENAAGTNFPDEHDTDESRHLRALFDVYTKRRLNGIALFFAIFTMFIALELSFLFFGKSKPDEFAENIFSNIIVVEVPLYLCIKNFLCHKLVRNRIKSLDEELLRKQKRHLAGMTLFSAAYQMTAIAITLLAGNAFGHFVNIFLTACVIFAALVLLYDLTLRKKITFQNLTVNPKRIAAVTAVIVLTSGYSRLHRDTWYTQPYINSLPVVEHDEHAISYDEETGVYTIASSTEDFKILHLTDIHLGGSLYSLRKDLKALKAVYAEIEYTRPDLVIVTGDLTFPMGIMSLSLNNAAPVGQFAAFMRNVDIPWAFTYGNHDTENLATLSEGDLNELYKSLSYKTSRNLLYPYTQPDVTGRNNQLIEIRNGDGTLNQAIFLIDSNAYTNEGINVYDYIRDDQVEWYEQEVKRLQKEEGRPISSMVFFHIPLQQYRTAYELYEQGSDEVTYYFGENNEKMIDKVCCSDYPSKLFDSMLKLGSTKAVFCGHDHYNNMSLEYKGIRLTYGMSIDYLAMPGIENDMAQRGAELVTLHPDGTWEIRQIPLDGIGK